MKSANVGFIARVLTAIGATAMGLALILPSFGSQASCVMPTSGTVSGLTLVNDINACNGSILSLYSGASPPGSVTAGMFWYNTATNYIQQYDGANWSNTWFVDATNHLTTPPIGGGITTAALSSAATTDIGSVPQPFKLINGTTGITSFGSSATNGTIHVLKFTGILTLTHNATSLILPGGQPITTAAGDIAFAIYLGSGNWQVLNFSPATGAAVANPAVPLGTTLYGDFMTLPPKTVYGAGQAISRSTFPGYLAAVTRTQSMIRTSGNATLGSVADTSGFGAGMPVEGAGISAGCTIASVNPNFSITLNSSTCVTASGSTNITVFGTGYGAGGDSTTVGVKDCRNRVLAGRGDMLSTGTNVGRLTTSYFGGDPTALNSPGGVENVTMALGNMIAHTHANTLTDPGHVHTQAISAAGGSPGGFLGQNVSGVYSSSGINTFSNVTNLTINNVSAGSGSPTPMRTVQPTVVANCVVVVSP